MRKRYPSDLTDEQWALIAPLLPPAKPGGRPRVVDLREVVNALFYQARTGCQWDFLPHDLVPKGTAYDYFARWHDDGTWQKIVDALRTRTRTEAGRDETPSAALIDSQTVKATEIGGPVGYDGGKKIKGRKRHYVVDTLGLLLAVAVTAGNLDDGTHADRVLRKLDRGRFPRLGGGLRRQQVQQPGAGPLAGAGGRPVPGGGGGGGETGGAVQAGEVALGGGADDRLDGAVPAVEPGLRIQHIGERDVDLDRGDPTDDAAAEARPR